MKYLIQMIILLLTQVHATENSDILFYLGNPVKHTHQNEAYHPEALKKAFAAACKKSGVKLYHIQVDSSEYPPLLYGKTEKRGTPPHNMQAICKNLSSQYSYSGSTASPVYFCIDIIPFKEHPPELIERIMRRTIRQAILQEKAKQLSN